jgi:hypothetical protein
VDLLIHFYQGLPAFVKLPVDFLFSVVIVRGIIAKEISDFIRDAWHKSLTNNDRKSVIWNHYQADHGQALVACQTDNCAGL